MNKRPISSELYTTGNYIILAIGLAMIVAGYIALAIKPLDGIATMVVAPFLLVIGYCVILPIAFFWKPKKQGTAIAKTPKGD